MKHYLFLIVFLSQWVAVLGEDPKPSSYLASLNYWEISAEVVRSEALHTALEIAPWQNAALREMRSDKAWEQRYFETMMKLSQKQSDEYQAALAAPLPDGRPVDAAERRRRMRDQGDQRLMLMTQSHTNTWTELNDVVAAAMRKILTDSQMEALRPTLLRKKFYAGFLPFADLEVATFCGMTTVERAPIQADMEQVQASYVSTVAGWRLQSGRKIASSLPPTSQQLFAQFMGNSLTPGLHGNADIAFDSLPFRPLTHLSSVFESPVLQNALKLAPNQLMRLTAIDDRFRSQFHSVPGKSMEQHFAEIEQELAASTRQVLTNKQAVQLAQHLAVEAFLLDYSSAFSRVEVLAYLELNEQESKAIVALAAAETRGVRERIRELDRQLFNSLSAKLSGPSRQKIEELFRGVWEIEL